MNLKVANLVAVQCGIFIGMMSWLAYSRLESVEPRIAAELQERAAKPAGPVGPGIKADDQRPDAVDDGADRDEPQPIAEQAALAMHQYSAAAVQHYSDLAAQQYYQQIAPRRYASSALQNGPIVAEAPSYAEAAQEPTVVSSDDPVPQTIAYVEPTQVVVYQQPQFVVFSNSRRFANRCRPAPHSNALAPIAHRRPDRPRLHLNGSTVFESPASPSAALRRPTQSLGVVQRRNDKVTSCRPTEGFGPLRPR